jgi:muramidase (phage lysozyme)
MSMQFYEATLLNKNIIAFLDTIGKSEGAQYDSLFNDVPNGSNVFTDFSKHPDIEVPFRNGLFSSAAGRYQILYKTWLAINKSLPLPDFSPHSQDLGALVLISGKNCLELAAHGIIHKAIAGCGEIWASLPDNTFNQPEHPMDLVVSWYVGFGGVVND